MKNGFNFVQNKLLEFSSLHIYLVARIVNLNYEKVKSTTTEY